LAYNFLNSTKDYDDKSYLYYDLLVRDFFKYLAELPDQDYYLAPGSNQRVNVKKKFQRKAKKAYELCVKAIEAEDQEGMNGKWKKVFGRPFPAAVTTNEEASKKAMITWDDTEEFIENKYPVDIRNNLEIDCDVSQNGYRENKLVNMLRNHIPLLARKKLLFSIVKIDVPEPYHIEWKILNRGDVAERKNKIRGQIDRDEGKGRKEERTSFRGNHIVDCYAIRNGVVVAKDRIDVPIKNDA